MTLEESGYDAGLEEYCQSGHFSLIGVVRVNSEHWGRYYNYLKMERRKKDKEFGKIVKNILKIKKQNKY